MGESKITKKNCENFIKNLFLSSKKPKVLVIGGGDRGSGTDKLWNNKEIEIHSIDIYASDNVDVVCDGHYLCFKSDYYDGVWIQAVLEHVVEPNIVVNEIYRVLKPGGNFLPSVPSFWPEKICWALSKDYQNMPGGHVRIFKKNQVISEITNHGFEYQSSERFHGLHSAYWWLRCMFWSTQESNWMIKKYKQLLEHQILQNTSWLQNLENLLNPVFGKSIAYYFKKNNDLS